MAISLFFSGLIYFGTIKELERGFRWGEIRLKAKELNIPLPRQFPEGLEELPPRLRERQARFLLGEDLETVKKRLAFQLLSLNGIIFLFSAGVSWLLAGKTLKPLEQALEEQKRFVADASHELRTPLTALKTSIEVALRDQKLSLTNARKVIKSNLEDVNGLQTLADNLLKLTNYQTNGQGLVFKELDIKKIAQRAFKKILPSAEKKEIKLIDKVESQKITANLESLEEMLLIFLDNAVKYTLQKGKVTVGSRLDKKALILEIKDTGIGIAKKDLGHIFDRFYRVDQSRSKSKVAGFGLGLSLAKKIIEFHQGSVQVKSELGKGTTFTIRIPLKHS